MERAKTMNDDFFMGIPTNIPAVDDEKVQIEWADISGLMSESLVVLDLQKRNILHVPRHYLCLCGYSPEKVKELGADFFNVALHPDDLQLSKEIHAAILKSLCNHDLPIEKISFFGCTLRIKSFLSEENGKPAYLMVYVKIIPTFQQGIPVAAMCLLSIDVVSKSGNLTFRYVNGDEATYSFVSRKWINQPFSPLTKREKQVLVLSQQGYTNEQIADKLHVTIKAVEKTKTILFEDRNTYEGLNLNSFSKKLQYAINRCLIYQSPTISSRNAMKRTKK